MRYRLTMTVDVTLSGGTPGDISGFIAETIRKRLSAGNCGRYVFAGEVVANTLERVLEDEIGDRHTVVAVHLNSLKTKCKAR